jgi:hypothetical protein
LRRYLLDTSVVSAFGPGRPPVALPVANWFTRHGAHLHVSVVTVMEIESGIRQYARRGSERRVDDLSKWLAALETNFEDRLFDFDQEAAKVAGRLEANALARGRHPGLADIIIAAIGEVNGLTILTQNLRHFRPLGVPSMNPFRELP